MRKNPFTIDVKVGGLEYSEDTINEISKVKDKVWEIYPRAQVARSDKESITFEVFYQ